MNPLIKSGLRACLPRSIKPHHIWAGPLRGQRIVTSWYDYPAAILGRTERPLLTWFDQNVHDGETWLDVGAHFGYTAIALSRLVGPHGRVYAFEPMLSTVGHLARTRLLNNLTQLIVLPVALADPESFAIQSLPIVRGMIDSTQSAKDWQETIGVVRLDWFWPQISGSDSRIDGIKIDVQGMEITAVHGMAELLKKFKPKLVVEVHRGVSRDELLKLLSSLGYAGHGTPIESTPGEAKAQYIDDRSYAFEIG